MHRIRSILFWKLYRYSTCLTAFRRFVGWQKSRRDALLRARSDHELMMARVCSRRWLVGVDRERLAAERTRAGGNWGRRYGGTVGSAGTRLEKRVRSIAVHWLGVTRKHLPLRRLSRRWGFPLASSQSPVCDTVTGMAAATTSVDTASLARAPPRPLGIDFGPLPLTLRFKRLSSVASEPAYDLSAPGPSTSSERPNPGTEREHSRGSGSKLPSSRPGFLDTGQDLLYSAYSTTSLGDRDLGTLRTARGPTATHGVLLPSRISASLQDRLRASTSPVAQEILMLLKDIQGQE